MTGSYWQKYARSRLSRRRALLGAAGIGAGAAALIAGCGGGNNGGGASGESGGSSGAFAVYKPKDTTSQAKAGGTFRDYVTTDVVSFDPLSSSSFNTQ